MAPFYGPRFGNPSSLHRWGRDARTALDEARERLAGCLGARSDEICFTSGGTEADNLAILGGWRVRRADGGGRNEIGTVQPVEQLAATARSRGALFHTDAVQAFGKIDIDARKVPFDALSVSG